MKQSIKIWILAGVLSAIFACFVGIGSVEKRSGEAENRLESETGNIAEEENKKKFNEERPEEILEKGSILQSDNEFEFFRTSSDELNGCYYNLGTNYIVVHDLRDDFYIYLPDSYEIISDIRAEESCIVISYANGSDYAIQEVVVPICFPARIEGILGMYSERYVEGGKRSWFDKREICPGEAVLENTLSMLPVEVWREAVFMDDNICEITFERISPIYRRLHSDRFEHWADYRLVIRDEDGSTICEQIFMDCPVQFEETYWIADFSGDDYSDIIFCTELNYGTGEQHTHFCTLIWNAENNCYEKKYLPMAETYRHDISGFPLWNENLHVLIVTVGTDKWGDSIHEMYSFESGEWQKIRRLETAYSETEFYDMPGEEELYPVSIGDWELFYVDGKEMEKKFIESEFYDDSAWSKNNKENLKLYPDSGEWECVSEIIDGIELDKEVRK